ncbi:hypothetical protein F5I97DRAFT_1927817 [Phlebopus sp. FC_14]|nr:hypothetical protein F5I97DRAFT_1927817 [Phlebopus sp. FC_14]
MSMLHLGILLDEKDDEQLIQPILIYFSGELPRHLINDCIPIQVTISIASEYQEFITLIINMISEACDSSQSSRSLQCSERKEALYDLVNLSISFLPLSADFYPMNCLHWISLRASIQHWLVLI